MLLLFFTANWQIVHGQSDLINELENHIGQNLQGRHVLEVNPVGNDGYYVSGVNTDNDMLFVARTDPYGNPYWFKTAVTSGTERLAMEVDDRFGTFDVLLSYDNGGDVYALRFDMTGVMAYPNALRIATNAVPSEIRSIRDSGLRYYGFLCSDRTDPYLYLSWIDAAGNVPISNTYEVPWHSKHGNDASFLQVGDGTEDLLFTYGTDLNLTAICFFRTQSDGTLMIFPGGTDHIYMHRIFSNINEPSSYDIHDIQEIADPFGVNPRAYVIAGGVSLYGAGSTQLPFSGLFDDVVDIVYANQFSVTYPYEFSHLTRQIERGTNDMLAAAVSYPTPFNDGELHFIQYDFGPTQIINFQMIKAETGSTLMGESHFPMSFALNQINDLVFTSYNDSTPGKIPFVSLNGGFNITGASCSLEEPDAGVDELLWQGSFYQPSFFFANATSQNTVTINNEFLTAQYLCNNPCPTAQINIDYEGCFFDNLPIELTAENIGFTPTNYVWSPGLQTTQSINVTSPGTYRVMAFDAINGCVATNQFTFNEGDLTDWHARSYSHIDNNDITVDDIESDPAGNIYVMGTFHDEAVIYENPKTNLPVEIESGNGEDGFYIIKYDNCGIMDWVAYSDIPNAPGSVDISGVDIEYRNGELRFLFEYSNSFGFNTNNRVKFKNSENTNIVATLFNNIIDTDPNGNYILGNIEETFPGGVLTLDLDDMDFVDMAMGAGDEITSIEYISGEYFVAGRHNSQCFISEMSTTGAGYSSTGNEYFEIISTVDIVNDIEYYNTLGNARVYLTGRYQTPGFFGGGLPAPMGSYDAFVVGMDPGNLSAGTSGFEEAPGAGVFAEGFEVDYNEFPSGSGDFEVYITGVYRGDLNIWGVGGDPTTSNAFVSRIEDDGTNFNYNWTFAFQTVNLDEAQGTGVIVEPNTQRLYAVGEIEASGGTTISDQNGSVSITVGGGGKEMWAVELDRSSGFGNWLAGGLDADNYVNGVAAHNNDAFVGGHSNSAVDLFPNDPTWPVSPVINIGISGDEDLFVARVGDLSGSSGIFYKNEPNAGTSTQDEIIDEDWNVQILPNPSNGQLRIRLKSNQGEDWQLEVYNAVGSLIKASNNINAVNLDYAVDWSDLSSGLYLVRIKQGENHSTHRIVIN